MGMKAEETPRFPGPPVIVSGVGGSGTRLVADLLRGMGLFLGARLNRSSDNMQLAELFPRIRNHLHRCHRQGRPLVDADVVIDDVLDRFETAMAGEFLQLPAPAPGWGWKLPVSFLVVDYMHARYPEGRFIHVIRHGLDMAFSSNRNQLRNWGWLFGIELDPEAEPEVEARAQLDYWIAANHHFRCYAEAHLAPDQWLLLDFDELCRTPIPVIERLATFVGIDLPAAGELATLVRKPRTLGRYHHHDLSLFDERQLREVASFGFPVE